MRSKVKKKENQRVTNDKTKCYLLIELTREHVMLLILYNIV